ncbi:hypothetical protein MycrhN_0762 [Mycolicibacterium rhodesiae NBB3]|jgi:hypothetical protein|uniref:Uncharacterized protein n=2 Tax=Mycolicibacterium rhodesiae TaxID=36814 RepID=G8RQJ0_MYCRN|nr:hypothetical protein MycrhN_0762 [Mycolicibacterium rhodesiae NBB3]
MLVPNGTSIHRGQCAVGARTQMSESNATVMPMDAQTPRQRKVLHGIELRYMLAVNLDIHGSASIFELIEQLQYQGFSIPGRVSKTVSDALRWEMRRGRVRRLRRGVYAPGQMPRSTAHYLHQRAAALRDEADRRVGRDDEAFWDAVADYP